MVCCIRYTIRHPPEIGNWKKELEKEQEREKPDREEELASPAPSMPTSPHTDGISARHDATSYNKTR